MCSTSDEEYNFEASRYNDLPYRCYTGEYDSESKKELEESLNDHKNEFNASNTLEKSLIEQPTQFEAFNQSPYSDEQQQNVPQPIIEQTPYEQQQAPYQTSFKSPYSDFNSANNDE